MLAYRWTVLCSLVALFACGPPVPATSPSTTSLPSPSYSGTENKPVPDEWCAAREHIARDANTGPLATLDTLYLRAHARARAAECRRLESERLVIRYGFGALEARWKGIPLLGGPVILIPPEWNVLKDVSHSVFLAALLFDENSPQTRANATTAVQAVDAAAAVVDDASSPQTKALSAPRLERQKRLLHEIRTAIAKFADGKLDPAAQSTFFANVRPDLITNIREITAALVTHIDAAIKQIRAKVETEDPKAWDSVVVVIGTEHQSRAEEAGLRYFERLLSEPSGVGAKSERRIVITEGLWHSWDQYGVLSAHMVDRVGAARVFGDPDRLQVDVMNDDGGVLDTLLPPKR